MQRRSYRLLLWVSESVKRGTLRVIPERDHSTIVGATRSWLSVHLAEFPAAARPDSENLDRFANMFSSYLFTSFDLVDQPGKRPVSDCGCYCELCVRLVAAPNLRTKKLTGVDKKRARRLQVEHVGALAHSGGRVLSDAEVDAIVDAPEMSEAVALATYGERLIARCRGAQDGPEVLALWRKFAWTRAGSPKKGFELTADLILESEGRIVERLAR